VGSQKCRFLPLTTNLGECTWVRVRVKG